MIDYAPQAAPPPPSPKPSTSRFPESGALGTGLVFLGLLTALVPALGPLLGPGTPNGHDVHIHIFRIMALDRLAAAGVPYTRWVPDLAYGYGMPLYNYYAPLVYVPAVAARQLGASYATSLELTAGFCLVASALAMFLLARALFGVPAALAASLVYAYLPYLFVDLYVRGALAEGAAFAWLPLACWCLLRLRTDPRRRWASGLALSLAGLILTHNITALISAPALAVLAAALRTATVADLSSVSRRAYAARVLAATAVGGGLAAWFWLPALVDRGLVQIGAMTSATLTDAFLLRDWPPFQISPAYDYQQPLVTSGTGLDYYWPRVGLVQLLVSVGGGVAALRTRGLARRVLFWAAGLALGAWSLQFGGASLLYRAVPLALFVQYPWRLLVLVGLGSALLAGGLVAAASSRRPMRFLVAGVVVAVSVWTALARLNPSPIFPEDRYLTSEALLRSELADYGLGTTWDGEYLPASSGQGNARHFRRTLLAESAAPGRGRSLPTVQYHVDALDWTPLAIRARVTAPAPDRLLVHQFAFPGWHAFLDGQSVPLADGGALGLLAVDVPAGTHDVELQFGWTSFRVASLLLTLLAVVGLGALAFRLAIVRPFVVPRSSKSRLGLTVLALTTVGTLGLPRGIDRGVSRQAELLDPLGRLALVGARLDTSRLDDGGPLAARLQWLVLDDAPDGDYEATVRVDGPEGASHEAPWAYGSLMKSWQRGELVATETNLRLPTGFPAGRARVSLSLRAPTREGGSGLPAAMLGDIVVPTGRRLPPEQPFAVVAPRRVTDTLELVSYELRTDGVLAGTELRPGGIVDARSSWRANGPQTQWLVLALLLHGPGGSITSKAQPLGQWFNVPFGWQAGDQFRQQAELAVPDNTPTGGYDVSYRVLIGTEDRFAPTGRFQLLAEVPIGKITVRP